MTSLLPLRAIIGILGSALLATSFVVAAAGPAFAAPIAPAAAGTIAAVQTV